MGACDGQISQGPHGKGDMAIPTGPVADFILVETHFIFSQLKAFFHCPALSGDVDQRLECRLGWSKHDKISQFTVSEIAPYQQGM